MLLSIKNKLGYTGKFQPPFPEFVKIFSHPRSGTHFLEAFVAKNFYQNTDLELGPFPYGHWKKRVINENGYPYGKLFGSHLFPDTSVRKIDYPSLYIYRDGRAVAYSLYNTENFLVPGNKDISLSEFLNHKLDWKGSPGYKSEPKLTIAEHWYKHVLGWHQIAESNSNILIVRYDDLVNEPFEVCQKIRDKFFRESSESDNIQLINKPVGLLPNKAKIMSWKEGFSEEDDKSFLSKIPKDGHKFLSNEK